jgi:hypothetical protein
VIIEADCRVIGTAANLFRHRFAAVFPVWLKTAPPFTLPSVGVICCSTDLGREALRFLFGSAFLAGVPAESRANQSP